MKTSPGERAFSVMRRRSLPGTAAGPFWKRAQRSREKADPSPPFAKNATGFGMTTGVKTPLRAGLKRA